MATCEHRDEIRHGRVPQQVAAHALELRSHELAIE
jgi:hypothetical protein